MVAGRSVLVLGLVCALVFLGGCQADVSVEFDGTVADGGSSDGADTGTSGGGEASRGEASGSDETSAGGSTDEPGESDGSSEATDTDADADRRVTTVVVGIENDTDTDVAGPLREAAAWWNERDGQYDTAWEADFVVRPDAENPDLVARFAEDVDCDADAPACAPRFDSSEAVSRYDGAMKFALGETPNRAALVQSAKHELGHVRGIDHCEPPHWLMGCPGSTEHEEADFRTREFAWRSETDLNVYLDGEDPEVRRDVRAVLDEYENRSETPADLTFRFVDDPWRAHIVLAVESCTDCGYTADVPAIQGGQSYDDDGNLEFIYWADVDVTTSEDLTRRALRTALDLLLVPEEGGSETG